MKGIKRYKFPVAKQLRKNVQHGESMKVLLSHVQLFVTLWTVALQTSLSMGLSRQEYWSGLPCPSSGDLRDSGIKPGSPALQVESLPSEPPGKPYICKYAFTSKEFLEGYTRNVNSKESKVKGVFLFL